MSEFDLSSIVLGASIMFAFGAGITARLFKQAGEMMKVAYEFHMEVEALLDDEINTHNEEAD